MNSTTTDQLPWHYLDAIKTSLLNSLPLGILLLLYKCSGKLRAMLSALTSKADNSKTVDPAKLEEAIRQISRQSSRVHEHERAVEGEEIPRGLRVL